MCSFFWQTKSKTHTRLLHFELHLDHFWIHVAIWHSSFDVSSVGKYVAMVTSLMLVLCNISGISWVWRNVVYLCALNLIDSNKSMLRKRITCCICTFTTQINDYMILSGKDQRVKPQTNHVTSVRSSFISSSVGGCKLIFKSLCSLNVTVLLCNTCVHILTVQSWRKRINSERTIFIRMYIMFKAPFNV